MPPDAEGPQPGKSAAQDDENLPKVKQTQTQRTFLSCFCSSNYSMRFSTHENVDSHFFCGFMTDKFLKRTKTGSRTFKNCRRRSALNPVRNRDQHCNLFSTFSSTAPNKWQGSSGEMCVRPWRGDLHVLCQLLCSQHSSGSRWVRWRLINRPIFTGCSVWLQLLSCTYTTQLPPSLLLKMIPNSRPTNKQPQ